MARRTARRKLREGDSLLVYNLIGRGIIVLKQLSFRGIARLASVSPLEGDANFPDKDPIVWEDGLFSRDFIQF